MTLQTGLVIGPDMLDIDLGRHDTPQSQWVVGWGKISGAELQSRRLAAKSAAWPEPRLSAKPPRNTVRRIERQMDKKGAKARRSAAEAAYRAAFRGA